MDKYGHSQVLCNIEITRCEQIRHQTRHASSCQPLIISFFSPYSPASLVTPLDSTLQSTIRSLIPPSLVTMVSFFSYAPLALLALSDVSGALVPTHNRLMKRALTARSVMPPTYAQGYLEVRNPPVDVVCIPCRPISEL
jgi:hypothetical protein